MWSLKFTVWDALLSSAYQACPAFVVGGNAAPPKVPRAVPVSQEVLQYLRMAGVSLEDNSDDSNTRPTTDVLIKDERRYLVG